MTALMSLGSSHLSGVQFYCETVRSEILCSFGDVMMSNTKTELLFNTMEQLVHAIIILFIALRKMEKIGK